MPILALFFAMIVNDPGQTLNKVSAFLNTKPESFSERFKCGDQSSFDQYYTSVILSCGAHVCSSVSQGPSVPNTLVHTVSNCTSDQVSIYSDDGDNLDLSKVDFETLHGSIVEKLFLKLPETLGINGKLDLVSVNPSANFVLNPSDVSSPTFPALNLVGKFTPDGATAGVEVLYTLLNDAPGVAQVARLRVDQTTIYRLKEIKKAL